MIDNPSDTPMIDNPSLLFVVVIKFVVKAMLDLPYCIELCPGLLVSC